MLAAQESRVSHQLNSLTFLSSGTLSFLSRRLQGRREFLVLPPADSPFPSASDGLVGLGGEGNVRIPTRRCRLGFLRFRIWSSRRARVVEAARQPWNKVLRPSFHLVVTRSGAGDGLVGFVLVGFGAPDLDEPCTRVCCRQAWPAALREVTSGEAVRFADVRFDGLVLPSPVLWQDCQVKAQVSAGRVPGRWPFTVFFPSMAGFVCGSCQSLCAMVLSWACGWRLLFVFSSGAWLGGGFRRLTATPVVAEALRDLIVIFWFVWGLCEVWLGQLSPLYPLRMTVSEYAFLYVVLTS